MSVTTKVMSAAAALALAACALVGCASGAQEAKPELHGTGEVGGTRSEAVLPESQRDSLRSPSREGTSFTQFMRLDDSYSPFMYSEDMVEFAEDARAAIAGQGGDPTGYVKCYPEHAENADGTVTAYFASPPDRIYAVYYEVRYDPAAALGSRVSVVPADRGAMPAFADDATVQ